MPRSLDELAAAIERLYDHSVFAQMTDEEFQEALLEDGVMADLRAEGRGEEADDILWHGLSGK